MKTDEIIRSLARDLTPVRRLLPSGVRAAVWGGCAIACVAIGTLVLGPRRDLASKAADPQFWVHNAVLLLGFVASARMAFRMSVPGEEARDGDALPFWAFLLWGGLLAEGALLSHAGTPRAAGWPCVMRMACLAAVPAAASLAMLRRGSALRPGWTGSIALLSAASLSVAGMQVVCVRDDAAHMFFWHFLPAMSLSLAGIQLGRWILRRGVSRPLPG